MVAVDSKEVIVSVTEVSLEVKGCVDGVLGELEVLDVVSLDGVTSGTDVELDECFSVFNVVTVICEAERVSLGVEDLGVGDPLVVDSAEDSPTTTEFGVDTETLDNLEVGFSAVLEDDDVGDEPLACLVGVGVVRMVVVLCVEIPGVDCPPSDEDPNVPALLVVLDTTLSGVDITLKVDDVVAIGVACVLDDTSPVEFFFVEDPTFIDVLWVGLGVPPVASVPETEEATWLGVVSCVLCEVSLEVDVSVSPGTDETFTLVGIVDGVLLRLDIGVTVRVLEVDKNDELKEGVFISPVDEDFGVGTERTEVANELLVEEIDEEACVGVTTIVRPKESETLCVERLGVSVEGLADVSDRVDAGVCLEDVDS